MRDLYKFAGNAAVKLFYYFKYSNFLGLGCYDDSCPAPLPAYSQLVEYHNFYICIYIILLGIVQDVHLQFSFIFCIMFGPK